MWIRKKFSLLLLSLLVTITSPFAGSPKRDYSILKEIDFKKIGPHQSRELHIKMVRTIIKFESQQKYEKFQRSFYSFNRVWKDLTGLVISDCYAADGDLCLFGGWPSVERSSKCRTPWSGEAQTVQDTHNLTKYLENGKCGDGNLFRCNPTIFGPGLVGGISFSATAPLPSSASEESINGIGVNSNPTKGICVKLDGTYNELSKKCGDVSSALDKAREENGMPDWRNDSFFEERSEDFKKLIELVGEQCADAEAEGRPTDGMCESLLSAAHNVYNAGMANQINDELLTEMGLSCVIDSRVTQPKCNPDDKGPILRNLWDGLAEAIATEDDCRAKFAITNDGEVAENFGAECNISITQGALAYSQEVPHGPGDVVNQTYKIVYMDGTEKKVLDLQAANNTSADSIKERFLELHSSELKNACELAYQDKCIPDEQPGIANLQEALEDLKNRESCRFAKVQAFDEGEMVIGGSGLRRDSIGRCEVGIGGNLQNYGITAEQNIFIGMTSSSDPLARYIQVRIDGETSKEDILAQLTSGENQSEFEEVCSGSQNGMCGATADSALGRNVSRKLRELADLEVDGNNCGFSYLQLHPGDYMEGATPEPGDDAPSESAIPENCRALLSEGAARELETNSYPKRMKLQVRRGGKVELKEISIGTPSAISLHALQTGQNSFLHDLCNEELVETPADTAERERRESAAFREAYGLSEGQHLTEEQESALRNLLEVEGLNITGIEITPQGNIRVLGSDLKEHEEEIKAAMGDQVVVYGDGSTISWLADSTTRVDHMVITSGADFTPDEIQSLISLESTRINDSATFNIESVRKEGEAIIVIPESGMRPNADLPARMRQLESSMGEGYNVQLARDETGAIYADRRYIIRPEASVVRTIASLSPNTYRDIEGSISSHLEAVRGGGSDLFDESNYNIRISGSEVDGDHTVVTIRQNMAGDHWNLNNSIPFRNQWYGTMRRRADRLGCSLSPSTGAAYSRSPTGELSLRCPNAPSE